MEKFTIVIPTLNRCTTLADTLETCVSQEDENFRVLVSDNLSNDSTRDVVDDFQRRDRRVERIQPPGRLGMAEHYEFALGHVREGFLMILGSDDGLLPGAIPRARAHLRNHPDVLALHAVHGAMFHYPDFNGEDAGLLHLRVRPRLEMRTSRDWLARVARSECHIGELPQPYGRAFIHTSLLKQIMERTGRYVHSSIPDFSLAAGMGAVTDKYLFVSPCFAINGLSPAGTGASMIYPSANRDVEKEFFSQNGTPIHPLVNYTRSEIVLIGEVLLQARDAKLLPPDFPIAWDRMIARAYLQLRQARWSEADRSAGIEALGILARTMGCPGVIESALQAPTLQLWKHGLPFDLAWHDDPWDFILDTRPLNVKGVHEAARLAGVLMQAAEASERSPLRAADATSDEALQWAVLSMAGQNSALRLKIQSLTAESERRAGERDRAKMKHATLTAKRDRERERARNARTSRPWLPRLLKGTTSWLPKWLRARRRDF